MKALVNGRVQGAAVFINKTIGLFKTVRQANIPKSKAIDMERIGQ